MSNLEAYVLQQQNIKPSVKSVGEEQEIENEIHYGLQMLGIRILDNIALSDEY